MYTRTVHFIQFSFHKSSHGIVYYFSPRASGREWNDNMNLFTHITTYMPWTRDKNKNDTKFHDIQYAWKVIMYHGVGWTWRDDKFKIKNSMFDKNFTKNI